MNKQIATAFLLFACQVVLGADPVANIGQRTLRFTDETRHRPVVTELWYPTDDSLQKRDKIFSPFTRQYTVRDGRLPRTKHPLIILWHATGGGRVTMEWLAQGLVRSGYIVAAVDHWGNTYDNKIPLEFVKPWERPLDISFALTSLLNDTELKQTIDPQRIGAIGFSYGGYTVLALAGAVLDYDALITYYKTAGKKEVETPELPGLARYLDDSTLVNARKRVPTLKDMRINSFFSISPALGAGFTKKQQVKQVDKPVYIVGSKSDSMAPVKPNARHFHELIAGSGYYEFSGKTGHYVMLNEAIDDVKKSDPTYFVDDASVSRKQVHEQVIALADKFFKQTLLKD